METKACAYCNVVKPVDDTNFPCYYNKTRKAFRNYCRACAASKQMVRDQHRLANPTTTLPAERTCATCKLVLPASDFTPNAHSKDGLNPYCKPCSTSNGRNYREKYKSAPKGRVQSKLCKGCNSTLPGSEFRLRSNVPDGLESKCKACKSAEERAQRAKKHTS
jgi:hypothetical protein